MGLRWPVMAMAKAMEMTWDCYSVDDDKCEYMVLLSNCG